MSTMKAVRFHTPGPSSVLKIESIPIPEPGAGQVLVRVQAVGLNKVDALIRLGYIPIPPPVIPGVDASGVVEEVGMGETQFKKGDRVVVDGNPNKGSPNGTYAQFYVAKPHQLTRLPDNYTFQEGAALPTAFMTAYRTVAIVGGAKKGDVVLINGASGAVGLCALEVCKALECSKVIGVAGNPKGLELISQRGATAISYKDPDFIQKVQEAAGKNGVDVILETQPSNLPKDLIVMAQHGRAVIIGVGSGSNKEELDAGIILGKELTITSQQVGSASEEEYRQMHAAFEKAIKDGTVRPVIEKVYSIDQVAQAHDALMSPRGAAGKLIMDVS